MSLKPPHSHPNTEARQQVHHTPTIIQSSSPKLRGGGPPKQKRLHDGVILPLSLIHCGLSGAVKATILNPFTVAALNELVEGLH